MATYRGIVKTNRYGTRGMLGPSYINEVRRDSARARKAALEAYQKLLDGNMPDDGGEAWLEVSDRFGVRMIARHVGKATRREPITSRVLAGEWVEVDV
jgi:hypothetical protein